MKENYIYSVDIEKQEEKDRFIVSTCLENLLDTVEVTPTDIKCSVDLKCVYTSPLNNKCPFNVEIKERNKNCEKYGYTVELTEGKYQRMRNETPRGTKLIYAVLFNGETLYLFDLDTMDWSKVTKFNWKIKERQYDPNSGYKTYPTFDIPLTNAFYKINYANNK